MKRKSLIEFVTISTLCSILLAFLVHIDGYELFMEWSRKYEAYEIDEFMLTLPVLILAVSIVGYLRWMDAKRLNKALQTSRNFTRNIIRSMADSLIVLNPNLTIRLVNAATLDLLGYSEKELIGKPMKMLLTGEELQTRQGLLYRIGDGQYSPTDLIQGIETVYQTKDGDLIPIIFTSSIIRNEQQEIEGIVSVAKDIRERKRAEEERKKLEEKLYQSQKMKALGTLTEGIAHDFNTLTATIIGYMDVMSKDLPPESPLQKDLASVSKVASQTKTLVRQLMDFSRPNSIEKAPTDLIVTVKESLEFLRNILPPRITIETIFETDPFWVNANKDQLKQLLFNLCINASDAMEWEDPLLKIHITKTDRIDRINKGQKADGVDSPGYVRLSLSDNGSGMSPDVIDRIFDPYFTTKEFGKSSGLGLSIVHGIVKGHEGEISVESELNKGTTFHIVFPLSKPN